jgi:hypothetical protein
LSFRGQAGVTLRHFQATTTAQAWTAEPTGPFSLNSFRQTAKAADSTIPRLTNYHCAPLAIIGKNCTIAVQISFSEYQKMTHELIKSLSANMFRRLIENFCCDRLQVLSVPA